MIRKGIIILSLILLSAAGSKADSKFRPKVIVRPQSVVTQNAVTLGDIAHISAPTVKEEAMVKKLAKVVITEAPAPSDNITLLGSTVLDRIVASGFKANEIGYSIPRTVKLTRKGRVFTGSEVMHVLRQQIKESGNKDLRVRDVAFPHEHLIPIGETKVKVDQLGSPNAGRLPLRISVTVNEEESARFLAHANVDYWQDVPVLSRSVERGMLIEPEDVQMVRVNLTKQSRDVISSRKKLIGKRAKTRIGAGSTIRTSQVDIPPVVERGHTVTIAYRKNGIEATASGIVLTEGLEGDEIMVQNEASKKYLRAKVINGREVEVTQ